MHNPLPSTFDTWPPALRSAARLLFDAGQPMCIAWGPQRLLFYNDGFRRLLGIGPSVPQGRPLREAWPALEAQLGAIFERALHGAPAWFDDLPLSVSGDGAPGQVFVSFSASPIRGDGAECNGGGDGGEGGGAVAGVLGICFDTTARVRASLEHGRVEARLRLLDAIGEATRIAVEPKAIMEHSTRLLGEYLGVTRVAYADLEPDNDSFTIRHDWTIAGASSSVGAYSLDLFGSHATSNLRAGRTLLISDVDAELAPGDGFEMFNRIGIKAIVCCPLVRQGRLLAMMAVHQQQPRAWSADEVALVEAVVERCWAHIERVRSTEALRDADRRKSEFLATLAHELRNPLAPIRNGLELLRLAEDGKGIGDAARARVRAMMERQVGQMVHLIDDLLDIARISSGKVILQAARVDLQSVVLGAVETSQPLIEAAGHTLALELPPAPLPLYVDTVRLRQVLSNLLSNAAKYTPRGGSITLSAIVDGAMAEIRVADTGIGIPAESLGAVFEMFTQAPNSIGNAQGGLGIGLSLVRHLVALHGGSVAASSPGVGQGSVFTLRLPLAPEAGSGPA